MSISKPTPFTVRRTDFQNGTYTFSVESVIEPGRGFGLLTVSVTNGYLLVTSNNSTPRSEQSLGHVLQPDGSRIAQDRVTLIADEENSPDGTITVRSPLGETVQLTIQGAGMTKPKPVLQLSVTELLFPETAPGSHRTIPFIITQQGTDTPVTISVDASLPFTVATNSQPFAQSLTLVPSSTGTSVDVRYSPDLAGNHTGRLTITANYEVSTITLAGKSTTAFPIGKWLLGAAVLLVLGCVFWFRCQLFPSWCNPVVPVLTVSPAALDYDTVIVNQTKTLSLTVSQQNASTPVHLKVTDPSRFALSSSGQTYSDTLTVEPTVQGIQLFLKYRPNVTGRHEALVRVEAPYDTVSISLVGVGAMLRPPIPIPLPDPATGRSREWRKKIKPGPGKPPIDPNKENEMEKLIREQRQ